MRNIEVKKNTFAGTAELSALLTAARNDERRNQHFSISVRLDALAIHIQQKDLSGKEAAELLRQEATRFERSAQELG